LHYYDRISLLRAARGLAATAAVTLVVGLTAGCSGPSFGESLDTIVGIHDETVTLLGIETEGTRIKVSQDIGPGGCYDGGCPQGRWLYASDAYDPSRCDAWADALSGAGWEVTDIGDPVLPITFGEDFGGCEVKASRGNHRVSVAFVWSGGQDFVRVTTSWRVR
jgi:hypothetical protein